MSSSQDNNIFKKTSFLAGNNSAFIEEYYSDYLKNSNKLPAGWKEFFDGLKENKETISKTLEGPSWAPKKNIKKNNLNLDNFQTEEVEEKKIINPSLLEEAAKNMVNYADTFMPNKANAKLYNDLYKDVYLKMFDKLEPLYKRIREITSYPEE